MTSLFGRLSAAHHLLTREIVRERRKPAPNPLRLTRLKKERLAIKDRLFQHVPVSARTLRFVRGLLARLRHAQA